MDDGLTPSQSAEPFTLETAPKIGVTASHRQSRVARLRVPSGWPLVVVLAVQLVLSVRLVRADTAFQDEATYLWAGHLEWAHWLHGAAIPPFSSYFSGAPVIYPPIGALADSIGGLTAARLLSLVFMLGATALLWSATRRLFGRQAAIFAAALFAILGPTIHLGAFATYDALSVFLLALAASLVIHAGIRPNATRWMVAAGVALAIANATAYSSVLFDVAVILLAFLIGLPQLGRKVAATRCLTVLLVVAVLLTLGVLIGGSSYVHGIYSTTLGRVPGGASALTVLKDAWIWTGVIVVAAVCGVVIAWVRREGSARVWLLIVLTAAALLGPLEQSRLHTAASLDKHVGLGAWFAAMAAGYAVDRLIAAVPAGSTRTVTCAACVVALALPISLGVTQSREFSTDWPNATDFTAIFGPLVDHSTGHLLVEDPSIAEYYLHDESQWMRWSSTRNIVLPSGLSSGGPGAAGVVGAGNAGTYATKIVDEHYFSIVALNYTDTTSLDLKIAADLKRSRHYCVTQIVPYGVEIPPVGVGNYVIWRYQPQLFTPGSTTASEWSCA
jgi:Dolichyl-phosphate-mannose-protein mannosyltransferase